MTRQIQGSAAQVVPVDHTQTTDLDVEQIVIDVHVTNPSLGRTSSTSSRTGIAGIPNKDVSEGNAQTDPTTYLATALGGDDRGAVWAAALVTMTGVATMADLALVDEGMAGDAAVACGIPLVPTKKLQIALTQLRASLRSASLGTPAPPEAEMTTCTKGPPTALRRPVVEKRKTWSVWHWLAIVFFPITVVLLILYFVCCFLAFSAQACCCEDGKCGTGCWCCDSPKAERLDDFDCMKYSQSSLWLPCCCDFEEGCGPLFPKNNSKCSKCWWGDENTTEQDPN